MRKLLVAVLFLASGACAQNVGIGTTTPTSPLHIRSTVSSNILRVEGPNPYISFYDNTAVYKGFVWYSGLGMVLGSASGSNMPVFISPNLGVSTTFLPNGNVGLGTQSPDSRLDILGGQWDLSTTEGDIRIGNGTYRLKIGVATGGGGAGDARIYASGGTNRIILGANATDVMGISSTNGGSVIIGSNMTPATGYKLTVRGKAICEEVLVQLQTSWPDYVFEKHYNLMPISTLESFIKSKNHLPGIPSASDIAQKGGVEVGDMQKRLLEKIEELTLYLISQQKQIDELVEENMKLSRDIQALKK